jgi:cell division protein FtsA
MSKATMIFQEVLSDAESKAGVGECDPDNIFVAVTGNHISSTEGVSTILIDNPEHRVENHHISEVQANASVPPLSEEMRKIDSIARHFLLDGAYCETPLGLTGHKLDVHTHIILGNKFKIDNSLTPIRDTHCDNPKPVFSGLASAWVGIEDEEQDDGVLFIDFGAGVTEYILLHRTGVFASGVIAVGCDHIVNDLAIALELSFEQGGNVFSKFLETKEFDSGNFIEVQHSLGKNYSKPRSIPFDAINTVVELRIKELFDVIKIQISSDIKESDLMPGKVVVTGGGSMIPVTSVLAGEVFDLPVRIHKKNNMRTFIDYPDEMLSPINTTVTGLLVHASKLSKKSSFVNSLERSITVQFSEMIRKLKRAFKI